MKRSRALTVVAIPLVWVILAAFGTVSASPSGDAQRLGNSSVAILVTPTPTISKGTPPPKATVLPPPTKPASGQPADRVRRVNLGLQSPQAPRQPTGSWQLIYSDGFETGNWPYSPWTVTDLSNDGYDRKWGRSNYFGFWGLWPAAGGAHSVYPPTQYADNMNTRMRYGPFDLRDAKLIDLYFWLWRDIESCCDYVAFEVSVDGVNFQELGRWTDYGDWAQQVFYLDQYAGQSQVWVAWRFYSDYSITYAGPWVDDIEIWKYVPGQVTARGTFYYTDRDTVSTRQARYTKAYLYDWDADGNHDLLAGPIVTDNNGFFQFPTITNWDADDPDPDLNNRRLDLFVVWETDVNDSATARRRVTNLNGQAYTWYSFTSTNAPDGAVDFSSILPTGWSDLGAMWIFQDLRRGWEYVQAATATDPGPATAQWQLGQNGLLLPYCERSCFYSGWGGPYIFISDLEKHSTDTVVHELGHHYMFNANGWTSGGGYHTMFSQINPSLAWDEGWADFFALAANSVLNANDTCYDFDIGPCTGGADVRHYNLETHDRRDDPQLYAMGDAVEGRVAGALYDLFDNRNDGFDAANFGFVPAWWVLSYEPWTFLEFWQDWKARGYNKHLAVQALYQNSIDYNTTPIIRQIPDLEVPKNSTWNNAIDLWLYSDDAESSDSELFFWILNVTNPNCGVGLSPDGRYVSVMPTRDWLGSCQVTISVTDGIRSTSNTFTINVVSRWRIFLPVILK